ncbi:MAG TPA: DegT/DnrJ/EryC1/StrS family aminotransferase, partial [Pirellulales bacterium]
MESSAGRPAPRGELRSAGQRNEPRPTTTERSASRTAAAAPANHDPALPAVPLLDMQRQYEPLREAIRAAIDRVCESGRFILGPDCEQLEKAIAAYVGVNHGVACASGSDALLLALMAIGIQPGDEVIVPSFTFFATASAVSRLGAVPVFVDIEPRTFNMNPALIAERITSATKAIIPVHLFGQCADMPAIRTIGAAHEIAIIEDAAQAIGAACGDRSAGSMSEIGCFSFYPTKNLGAFGDAGMLTTDDDDLAARLRLLRTHGMEPRYYHKVIGINSRLDSIQAAVLNVKLPHVNRWAQLRRANAEFYTELMTECGLDRILT